MKPNFRKFALALHVIVAMGSLGAVASFMTLAIAGINSPDAPLVRSAYVAMAYLTPVVIVPLILAGLISGLVSSIGTSWGLFRYYWVVAKLVMTAISAAVLLLQLALIARLGRASAEGLAFGSSLHGGPIALFFHSVVGLLVLIAVAVLSIYKPWGMTPYGLKQLRTLR